MLHYFDIFNVDKIYPLIKEHSEKWWLIVVLILLQIILFTFALAGSLVFWLVVSLYPPIQSTLIVSFGAMLGGIGAYYFSSYITDEWIAKIENSHAYKLLHSQDNFFTLFALRVFPGFPHAVVNYSSGVLQVKLSHFAAAAFLGVGLKSYVYADIIYNLTTEASINVLLNFSTIAPLFLLSLITFVGVFIKYKVDHKK